LASLLAGLSLGGIACLRLRAKQLGRGLWDALRDAFLGGGDGSGALVHALAPPDRERAAAFVERFARHRSIAPRLSLESLLERVVADSGYDLAILAMPAGDRRLANVRKLMRIARGFEASEGREIRAFIDHLDERRALRSREGEAPVEGEAAAPAVRLMTIHAAKGLEFPVVCVADLGRVAHTDSGGGLEVSPDGRTGLRLASLSGETHDTLDWKALKTEQAERGEEEERRIFYVAMTRAKDQLVLSGAVDATKWPEPKPLGAPINWIWRAVAPGAPAILAADCEGEEVRSFEGHPVRVALRLCSPASVERLLPGDARAPGAREDGDIRAGRGPEPAMPSFGAVAVPPSLPVARISYSALESYDRCGYRFYLERVARLGGPEARPGPRARAAAPDGQLVLDVEAALPPERAIEPEPGGVSAMLRGTVVHELLERLELAAGRTPGSEEVAGALAAHGAAAEPDEVARIIELIGAFLSSDLCARVTRAERVRKELAFSFELAPVTDGSRALLVNGVVDVLAAEGDGLLVVDYKTDPLEADPPEAIVAERYETQRLVYALAALRSGAPRVEVAYSFLEAASQPVLRSWVVDDLGTLERRLVELAGGVLAGRFEPTATPHRELCITCPGRATLCTWGPEHTLRERPMAPLRS
ncbi:MAG: PD-(D/E)XK nuclease family protein, partial [Actinobacteria bacterium]|nr:PD-(D/E)XK nuclease family protein [Actinomycetota bacterium]